MCLSKLYWLEQKLYQQTVRGDLMRYLKMVSLASWFPLAMLAS